jgi:hypothetical protein
MSEIKKVRIQNIIESQIPEFLNTESPLFNEFLERYYISQEHPTGIADLGTNVNVLKNTKSYDNETFFSVFYPSSLTKKVLAFDDVINVTHTIGFPSKYGLIKIDDEIIFYTSKTQNSFIGCFRGFSGVNDIKQVLKSETINFTKTKASPHISEFNISSIEKNNSTWTINLIDPIDVSLNEVVYFDDLSYSATNTATITQRGIPARVKNIQSQQLFEVEASDDISNKSKVVKTIVVQNLNLVFYEELFKKFKSEFLPGFENREFVPQIKIQNILSRAIDFYTTKGTDTSFRLLFSALFGKEISIIKPQEYLLRPSDNNYFVTRNILVEPIKDYGIDLSTIKGKTIFQNIDNIESSASIYSLEYRPFNGKNLYEIYLDGTSFVNQFRTTKKTNISKKALVNSDNIFVDSTIGFPSSGKLLVKTKNTTDPVVITYNDKTDTQFIGVSGVIFDLDFGDEIYEENFVYVFQEDGTKLEFRLINVIGEIDYNTSSNLRVGDKIKLSSFGTNLNDKPEFNSWIYNLPTSHNIRLVQESGNSTGTIWTITLFDNVKFYVGEKIELANTNDENDLIRTAKVVSIFSENIIEVETPFNIESKNVLHRIIETGETESNLVNVSKIPIGVQNTYIDENNEYFYVTSSGIPNYKLYSKPQIINCNAGPGIGVTDTLNTQEFHRFYTGEKIYFYPSQGSGISTGIYHLTTIGSVKDSKSVKFSLSKSDLYSKKYITFDKQTTSGTFVKLDYENKEISNQKIVKKFNLNKDQYLLSEVGDRSTNNRKVGIFVNGSEIFSPSLFDENIYYGKLESISITNPGSGYDVINPPELEISDVSGSGARGYLNIVGSLKRVRIINPGIGYQIKPKITILGGNGQGAVVEPNFVRSQINNGFKGDGFGLNPTENTITFFEKHNFDDGEEVIYNSNSNSDIVPLKNNSIYYVGIINDKVVKLYENVTDAYAKTNEIDFIGISSGFHYLKTTNSKNTITQVYVKDGGSGYSNRLIKIPSVLSYDNTTNGVNTFDHYVFAKDHRFKNKDIVRYSTTGTEISGLSTTSEYIVTVVDNNKFKLSSVGTGDKIDEFDYINQRYIKFTSLGTGEHTFYYPPIRLVVETLSGVGATTIIQPEFEPIITGEIESVFLESNGVGYGVSDIINFHRRPDIKIKPIRSEALLKPVIVNGSIVDIQFLSYGSGYDKGIDIEVYGDGQFADIRPIVDENGRITSVNIASGGVNYLQNNTIIKVVRRGKDAKFLGNIFEWKINQIEKNKELLSTQDEGIIAPSSSKDLGLQYISFFVPKVLRYSLSDHIDSSNREIVNNTHSPIIGWAYDGNPIYGPYGQVGSEIRKIRSSYFKKVENNVNLRPNLPEGFFTQDYYFDKAIGDLDEYNGRFCITPEFPNGIYAYFATIDNSVVSKPEYPYIIGEKFKDYAIEENFIPAFNQNLDISEFNIIRNIGPYYINSNTSNYGLIQNNEEKHKQEFIVSEILSSSVDQILVYSPGEQYKIGDNVIFDNSDSGGSGISAEVSKLRGKNLISIEVGISTFNGVRFFTEKNTVVGSTDIPHDFSSGEQVVISAISSPKYSFLEGPQKILVPSKIVGLTSDVNIIEITGPTTEIYVSDYSGFEVNDFIGIGSEKLQVVRINQENSQLTVNRLENVGYHTVGIDSVKLLPRKFYFSEVNLPTYLKENLPVYFDPSILIGFGTQTNNYTLFDQSNLKVPERSIYIPNHNFYTGQKVLYNVGFAGSSLYVSNIPDPGASFPLPDNSTLYVINRGKDYIGISTLGFTTSIGIGTYNNGLYFYENNSTVGSSHSLTTVYEEVVGRVENYGLTAETEDNHELQPLDLVTFTLSPRLTTVFPISYDSIIRKLTLSPTIFDTSVAVTVENSTIYLPNNNFLTGDKIVYYNTGNSSIGGLINNETYYIIKEDPDNIKLAEYRSDAFSGIAVTFTGQGSSLNAISLVNPLLKVPKGNIIIFDLSDSSLSGMDLRLYRDSNLSIQVASYNYQRNGIDAGTPGAQLRIDTSNSAFSNTIFYNLIPLSPSILEKYQISLDTDVIGNNKISIEDSTFSDSYNITVINNNSFKFNLYDKPESFSYTTSSGISSIFYETTSKTASGPISKIRLNFGGKKYKKLPKIVGVESENGKNATLKCISKNIGKINNIERVKDGFDYPTDKTLKPTLSIPTVCQIRGISRVKDINILNGGVKYITPPKLKVIGNDNIELEAILQGNSVVDVKIIRNTKDLSNPLTVLPIRNSNGYDIDDITYNNITKTVTLELVNSDNQQFPLISNSYGSNNVDFPFNIGDKIFIENCKISDTSKSNYNSSNYGYRFFTVTGVSTSNFTVTYDASGITEELGEYTSDFGYGYVINKNSMAEFEMTLEDDLSYFSGEDIIGYDSSNSPVFTAKVMENGWDNEINQLRMIDSSGDLEIGYKIFGTRSRLSGIIESVNNFTLNSNLDVSREKLNDFGDRVGFLNDYQQRISDNDYYQKFSYSIKSDVNYEDWKESVRSLVHPAGFKEFSDLDIIQKASNNMNVGVGDSSLTILANIDGYGSMYSKSNFSMVFEDDQAEDGSIERILFPEGVSLKSYILSRTNKVIKIDDISGQFTGITTTSGGRIVGITTFKLKNKGTPLFYHEFSGISTSTINLNVDSFNITNHNFQSGQKIFYDIGSVDIQPSAEIQNTVDASFSYTVDLTFDSQVFTFDSVDYTLDMN